MNNKLLSQMLSLQLTLNNNTNGEIWLDGITQNGNIINWYRCIYMETGELIDSFSWKHWKNINTNPNWENIYIEVTDIWHFILSLAIKHKINLEKYLNRFKKETKNSSEILQISQNLLHHTSSQNPSIDKTIDIFISLSNSVGLDFNTLYELYIAKNVLNKFRQDNGYKIGKYIKIWNNKEDNEVLMQIIKSSDDKSFESLYTQLKNQYQKLNK